MPVMIPGSAIGSTSRNDTDSRPKKRNRSIANAAIHPSTSAIAVVAAPPPTGAALYTEGALNGAGPARNEQIPTRRERGPGREPRGKGPVRVDAEKVVDAWADDARPRPADEQGRDEGAGGQRERKDRARH